MMSTFSTVDQVRTNSASTSRRKTWAKPLAIGLVALVWLSTTFLLFRGYVGSDDVFYARYAFLFHRPPMNHWEFRIPAILAIRASFFALGPTEFAAALPTLLASLAILASVAWFVGWPSRLNWQTQIAMLLTATFPMDLGFRSIPGRDVLLQRLPCPRNGVPIEGTQADAVARRGSACVGFCDPRDHDFLYRRAVPYGVGL